MLIFPFAWLIVTSVETPAEALHFPPILTPHVLRFANYADALARRPVRPVLHQQRASSR